MPYGILLTVAYDGTAYSGFQFQKNGLAVQEVLETVIEQVEKKFIRIKGASRTDAGVHATGQRIFYVSDKKLPEEAYLRGMNALLPSDVAVKAVKFKESDFNPRLTQGKLYEYRILNSRIPDPINSRFHWQVYRKLNIENMRKAAEFIVGTHDFAAFQAADCERENSIRTIYGIKIVENYENISVFVSGSAFLKNMVRIMVGTLVEVGRNRFSPDDVKTILDGKNRSEAGLTAPARGLFLRHVVYKDEDNSVLFDF